MAKKGWRKVLILRLAIEAIEENEHQLKVVIFHLLTTLILVGGLNAITFVISYSIISDRHKEILYTLDFWGTVAFIVLFVMAGAWHILRAVFEK